MVQQSYFIDVTQTKHLYFFEKEVMSLLLTNVEPLIHISNTRATWGNIRIYSQTYPQNAVFKSDKF